MLPVTHEPMSSVRGWVRGSGGSGSGDGRGSVVRDMGRCPASVVGCLLLNDRFGGEWPWEEAESQDRPARGRGPRRSHRKLSSHLAGRPVGRPEGRRNREIPGESNRARRTSRLRSPTSRTRWPSVQARSPSMLSLRLSCPTGIRHSCSRARCWDGSQSTSRRSPSA